jgi:hypothetical protein
MRSFGVIAVSNSSVFSFELLFHCMFKFIACNNGFGTSRRDGDTSVFSFEYFFIACRHNGFGSQVFRILLYITD